jgi:hypothetical protein
MTMDEIASTAIPQNIQKIGPAFPIVPPVGTV